MEIAGAIGLVTGAASGLGAETARVLHASGAGVVLCDLNEKGVAGEVERLGDRAIHWTTDVTDEVSVRKAVDAALERFGALHVVVACAGVLIGEKILGKEGVHDLERFRRVVEVNLVGTFNVLRLAAEAMRRNTPSSEGERGVIVTTASVAAFEGQIGQAAYAASKAGVAALTLPAARELARDGIRVCSIAPGIFDTAMLAGLPEQVRRSLGEQVPFPPRLGRPSEYAGLVLEIIRNPMLNGETIRLDGALRMGAR
jgi:NAD(P)-dependent dehydrogenase (short-subunit alcohol dehydrogenase family)